MTKEEILKWMDSTEEGQAFRTEMISPYEAEKQAVLSNKEQILEEKRSLKAQLDNLSNTYNETARTVSELQKERVIDKAMRDLNISEDDRDLFSLKLQKNNFHLDEENRPVVGTQGFNEFLNEWKNTDEAKKLQRVLPNIGGGSHGSRISETASPIPSQMTRDQLLNQYEQAIKN